MPHWPWPCVGAATAFVAATIACAQQDIKKVLAYSTVSQLGYMFLAIGCGAYEAAIFLMVAHAFFKALLFLGAGSVIHGLHDEQDLKRMGNLRRYMPITFITFAIGWLAIAAVPPLSGFWAKGDVLENAFAAHPALWVVGLVTAALTAYYMSRLTGLAFFGERPLVAQGPHRRRATATMPGIPPRRGAIRRAPRVAVGDDRPARGSWPSSPPWPACWPSATGTFSLSRWVDPVFGANLYNDHLAHASIWVLAHRGRVIAFVGVAVGLRLWMTRSERPALETAFLNATLVHQRALRRRLRHAVASGWRVLRHGGRHRRSSTAPSTARPTSVRRVGGDSCAAPRPGTCATTSWASSSGPCSSWPSCSPGCGGADGRRPSPS